MIQGFFNLNQVRIAKTLCVEKDIKDSKCGGCCQLKKSLAEENTDDGAIPAEQKQAIMVAQMMYENLSKKLPKFMDECDALFPSVNSTLADGILLSVFNPPDVA